MRIIGVDLHTRQQAIAMLDTETGEVVEKTLKHDGDEVRKLIRLPASRKAREFELLIMIHNDRRDVWWATPNR